MPKYKVIRGSISRQEPAGVSNRFKVYTPEIGQNEIELTEAEAAALKGKVEKLESFEILISEKEPEPEKKSAKSETKAAAPHKKHKTAASETEDLL